MWMCVGVSYSRYNTFRYCATVTPQWQVLAIIRMGLCRESSASDARDILIIFRASISALSSYTSAFYYSLGPYTILTISFVYAAVDLRSTISYENETIFFGWLNSRGKLRSIMSQPYERNIVFLDKMLPPPCNSLCTTVCGQLWRKPNINSELYLSMVLLSLTGVQ